MTFEVCVWLTFFVQLGLLAILAARISDLKRELEYLSSRRDVDITNERAWEACRKVEALAEAQGYVWEEHNVKQWRKK